MGHRATIYFGPLESPAPALEFISFHAKVTQTHFHHGAFGRHGQKPFPHCRGPKMIAHPLSETILMVERSYAAESFDCQNAAKQAAMANALIAPEM